MTDLVKYDFHGNQIQMVKVGDKVFVALRPIVEAIGLQWSAQLIKLKAHEVLSSGVSQFDTPDNRGRLQKMVFIPLTMLQGWLFTINPNMVRPDLREKLIEFQKECFEALDSYWRRGFAINPRFEKIKIHEKYNDGQSKTPNQRFFELVAKYDSENPMPLHKYWPNLFTKGQWTQLLDESLQITQLLSSGLSKRAFERQYYLVQSGFDIEYIFTGIKKLTKTEENLIKNIRELPNNIAEIYFTQIACENQQYLN